MVSLFVINKKISDYFFNLPEDSELGKLEDYFTILYTAYGDTNQGYIGYYLGTIDECNNENLLYKRESFIINEKKKIKLSPTIKQIKKYTNIFKIYQ